MSDFRFSNAAENARHRFFNKQFTVYVEGQDDILFWEQYFQFLGFDPVIQDTGGSNELNKYIDRIIDENLNVIVAKDKDLCPYVIRHRNHDRVILTYGYSIENSLACAERVSRFVKHCSRSQFSAHSLYLNWRSQINSFFKEILIAFIVHESRNSGVKVLDGTMAQFIASQHTYHFDLEKIEKKKSILSSSIPDADRIEVGKNVEEDAKDVFMLLKGHYLQPCFLRFLGVIVKVVRSSLRKPSWDHYYDCTIDYCLSCAKQSECSDFRHLVTMIESAVQTLK